MFELYADKVKLTLALRSREPLTSGSVNVYRARFGFSGDWAGLTNKAVFRGSGVTKTVLLDESGQCTIPWEVLASHGQPLMAGVFGTREETVLPTIWASLGTILEGVPADGEGARPPTPDAWQEALERKGDKLEYTSDGELGLYAGDKLLSAVPVSGGGGEGGGGGVSDHRQLSHRDAENQHPVEAISGLKEVLERIPVPMTAEQLRKILMNGGK